MKTYEEINERIERKKAVVMTAEEIIGYVERRASRRPRARWTW